MRYHHHTAAAPKEQPRVDSLDLELDPDMDDATRDAILDTLAGPLDNDLLAA